MGEFEMNNNTYEENNNVIDLVPTEVGESTGSESGNGNNGLAVVLIGAGLAAGAGVMTLVNKVKEAKKNKAEKADKPKKEKKPKKKLKLMWVEEDDCEEDFDEVFEDELVEEEKPEEKTPEGKKK